MAMNTDRPSEEEVLTLARELESFLDENPTTLKLPPEVLKKYERVVINAAVIVTGGKAWSNDLRRLMTSLQKWMKPYLKKEKRR